MPYESMVTDAVLSLDEDTVLSTTEVCTLSPSLQSRSLPLFLSAPGKELGQTAARLLSVDVDALHVCDDVCVCLPGGFCLHSVAEFSRENRRLSCKKPLLGQQQGALGLHVQVDQRLLHGADGGRHLPQVPRLGHHLPPPPPPLPVGPVEEWEFSRATLLFLLCADPLVWRSDLSILSLASLSLVVPAFSCAVSFNMAAVSCHGNAPLG